MAKRPGTDLQLIMSSSGTFAQVFLRHEPTYVGGIAVLTVGKSWIATYRPPECQPSCLTNPKGCKSPGRCKRAETRVFDEVGQCIGWLCSRLELPEPYKFTIPQELLVNGKIDLLKYRKLSQPAEVVVSEVDPEAEPAPAPKPKPGKAAAPAPATIEEMLDRAQTIAEEELAND